MSTSTSNPVGAANEARLRASGVNLSTQYGQWALNLARTSRVHLCMARKDFDFVCIQPGDGAGHRCALHGGASRGPKTPEGKARSAANLRQNRMRGPIHWVPDGDPVPAQGEPPAAPVAQGVGLGEYLTREEVATLTGKQRAAAQCRVLQALGIPFLRRDGVPIVSRVLVQQAMTGAGGAR